MLRAEKGAGKVDRERAGPLLLCDAGAGAGGPGHAGVVDRDVEPAERFDRRRDEIHGVLFRLHVAGERRRFAALSFDLARQRGELGLTPRAHHDLGPFPGEQPGSRPADPRARTRYDRDLPTQTRHGNLLTVDRRWRACSSIHARLPLFDKPGADQRSPGCQQAASQRARPSSTPTLLLAPVW